MTVELRGTAATVFEQRWLSHIAEQSQIPDWLTEDHFASKGFRNLFREMHRCAETWGTVDPLAVASWLRAQGWDAALVDDTFAWLSDMGSFPEQLVPFYAGLLKASKQGRETADPDRQLIATVAEMRQAGKPIPADMEAKERQAFLRTRRAQR